MGAESTPGGLNSPFASVSIDVDRDRDGVITLTNRLPLGPYPRSLVDLLREWAGRRPDVPFLAERHDGRWRRRTYAEVWSRTGELAARLLGAGARIDRPLMILAPNSIEHAELALAAMRVGVPVSPVSCAYAMPSSDFARLRHTVELATPAILHVPADGRFRAAAASLQGSIDRIVSTQDWDELPVAGAAEVARAENAVGPDTVAKLLFTSGSTDRPKAVPNTHRMLCSNQAALARIWPCLGEQPPVLVDWLPWNHTFGGNFTFNLALMHGGTFYIDAGKPLPALIGDTIANLRDIAPTAYFNVPAGYEALLPHLESDAALSNHFFSRLDFLFTAAAALPQMSRDRLDALARSARGRAVPILGGWGSTETAPCSTAIYFDSAVAGNIGLPLPGTALRLVPNQDKFDLRVKGPNVMSGYWRQAAAGDTFDEQGFYKMGDAGKYVDPACVERGVAFDGRTSENFKLRSGTWVQVAALRLAVIEAAHPLIQDVVVTGHDAEEVGLLIFPNLARCRAVAGVCEGLDDAELTRDPALIAAMVARLRELNSHARGASTRISRFLIQALPPQSEAHEITEKGYLNQRAVLTQRVQEVDRMYSQRGIRL